MDTVRPNTHEASPASVGAILHRLSAQSARPRYAFLVLNLLSEAADARGEAGPFIRREGAAVPIRDWLTEQLMPVSARDGRRGKLRVRLREAIESAAEDASASDAEVEAAVHERALAVGKTNVSRAVSDLVRAGLVERHYAGWIKDHVNRGGGRHAVYTVAREALAVMRGGGGLARAEQLRLI
ncbi:hypothetical protein Q5H94_07885 [Sphingomonas sp. CA1-15]|uniref:Uncharacterized protein n=2 Tax=Sphingomonas immobilis TaxID=3063997 RepID=A0ABT8ZXF2_9SPHN|nr:hypothetical protein [Sphingomonas sp. CA1-15]